jgi:predicted DNA-binding transcriptional regulator YafY
MVMPKDTPDKKHASAPNAQLRRCFALVRALTRNRFGQTKGEILETLAKMDVALPSDRTFQRDIEELRLMGYDISCDKSYRYKLENREEVIGEGFSFEEIQALQMSRDLFRYFEGTHLKETIDSVIDAVIGSQTTPFNKEDLEECRENFIVHLGWRRDFFDKKELLDSVAFGVNNSTKLKITYKKPNKGSETVIVEPYRIVLYHDTLYLLAKKESDSRRLRLYHVSRLEEVEETGEEFAKDRGLIQNYEKELSHSFGIFIEGELRDVEIRFDKSVEYMLRERLWHTSQTIETTEECVILKLRVYQSGEFMAWVRGWGEAVKDVKIIHGSKGDDNRYC